jgi:ankyrin repeat protein
MASQFVVPAGSANQAGRVPAPVLQPQPQAPDQPPLVSARPASIGLLASVPVADAGAHASSAVAHAPKTEPKNAEETALMKDRFSAYENFLKQLEDPGAKTWTQDWQRQFLKKLEFKWEQPLSWWNSALFLSVITDDRELVKLVLAQGADINAQLPLPFSPEIGFISPISKIFFTPEKKSAAYGNSAEVARLQSIIKKVMSGGGYGNTALFLAVLAGHEQLAEELIENGATIDPQGGNGHTVLHAAARTQNATMIRLLLGCGADIHRKDVHGRTALSHAAESGNDAAFNLLLSKGSRIEDVDKLGHAAIWYGDAGFVARQLMKGARIDCTGKDARLLLDRLIKDDQQQAIPALLQQGLNCDLENEDHKSPLDMAVGHNRIATVRVLLQLGADVNHVSGNERQTPLFKAVSFDFRAVLDALIASATIKLDHQDIDGKTALHLAAGRNRRYALLRLLDKGAAIDLQDHEGNTALSTACACGHWDIARVLVARGSDIQHANKAGLTPPKLAKDNGVALMRPLPALDSTPGQAAPGIIETLKGFGAVGQEKDALDWKDWLTCQGVGPRTIEALARVAVAQATVLEAMTGCSDEIVRPALQTVACAGMLAALAGLAGDAEKNADWAGATELAAAGLEAEAKWRKDLSALHDVCKHASTDGGELTPVSLYWYLTGVHGMAGLFAQDVASIFFLAKFEEKDADRPLAFARKLRQTLQSSYLSDKLAQARTASGNPETFDRLMKCQRDLLDSFCTSTLKDE